MALDMVSAFLPWHLSLCVLLLVTATSGQASRTFKPGVKIAGKSYVEKGQPLKLICNATGIDYAPTAVHWYKDGIQIRTNERTSITDQVLRAEHVITSTLLILDGKLEDTGTYVCRASNFQIESIYVRVLEPDSGSKRSSNGNVAPANSTFKPDIKIAGTLFVEKGRQLRLICSATGTESAPSAVDWFKDGNKIRANEHVSITDHVTQENHTITSTLVIQRADLRHSGTYVCRTDTLQVTSAKVRVIQTAKNNKRKPPSVAKESRPEIKITGSTFVEEGQPLRLVCNATGVGTTPAVVDWFKDRSRIQSGERVSITDHVSQADQTISSTLVIQDGESRDSGIYVCRTDTRQITSANVTVIQTDRNNIKRRPTSLTQESKTPKPEITITGSLYVDKGQPLRLVCNANGIESAPTSVDWFKDGDKIRTNERVSITKRVTQENRTITSTLVIQHGELWDSGTYICRTDTRQIKSAKVTIIETNRDNIKRGPTSVTQEFPENPTCRTLQECTKGLEKITSELSESEKSALCVGFPARIECLRKALENCNELETLPKHVRDQLKEGVRQIELLQQKLCGESEPTETKHFTAKIGITGNSLVERGQQLKLECNATGSEQAPDEVDWFKDGQNIQGRDRLKIMDTVSQTEHTITSTLVIQRVQMRDAGTYVCRSSDNQISDHMVQIMHRVSTGIEEPVTQEVRPLNQSQIMKMMNETYQKPVLGWLRSSTKLNWAQVKLAEEQMGVAKLTKKKLALEIARLKKGD